MWSLGTFLNDWSFKNVPNDWVGKFLKKVLALS